MEMNPNHYIKVFVSAGNPVLVTQYGAAPGCSQTSGGWKRKSSQPGSELKAGSLQIRVRSDSGVAGSGL